MALDQNDVYTQDDYHDVVVMYRQCRDEGKTPSQAVNILLGAMTDMIVSYTASGYRVPNGLLVTVGEVARWWELIHTNKPLPEDLL